MSLDQDLVDFAKLFAAENRTTVAEVITQYLLHLKRKAQGEATTRLFVHPAFYEAMENIKTKLRDDKAEWKSKKEAFSD